METIMEILENAELSNRAKDYPLSTVCIYLFLCSQNKKIKICFKTDTLS